jgi:hypothetical protein
MVGLSQGFPLATQPVVNPNGTVTQPWLQFFQGIWGNASQTTLPAGTAIPPGSVNLSAFNKFLTPIGLVNSLPSTTGYTGATVVFNSADGNLYRLVNGAWTLAVPASAVIGQIPAGSIPPIPTTQLQGYIQAAQIQANSIGADRISAAYVYAGSITASQITAGSLSAGVILTSSINAGQVNASSLSAISANLGTITAGTINGTTITGATIQTALSGSDRITITPGGFLSGYNSSNVQTIAMNVDLGGGGSLDFFTNSGSSCLFIGLGLPAPVYATAFPASGHSAAVIAKGFSSSTDAITCPTGGITISNGYINLTGNVTDSSNNVLLSSSGGSAYIGNTSHMVFVNNNIGGSTANTYSCGTAGFPWSGGYTQVAFTVTSDERLKAEISDETLGLAFIRLLRPRTFTHKKNPSGIHHGLVAQELEVALGGSPFAGLVKPKNGYYGVIVEEMISPIIKAIQELDQKLEDHIRSAS